MPSRPTMVPLVVLLLACGDGPASPIASEADEASSSISFEALGPGDTLVVVHHAFGCFYDYLATLIIVPSDHGARVSVADFQSTLMIVPADHGARVSAVDFQAPQNSGWHLVTKPFITPTELAGLDRLLAEYRRDRPPGLCTSVVALTLSLRHEGVEIRREAYYDDSCQGFADPSIVTVGSLFDLVEN